MGGTGSYANLSEKDGFAARREEDMHRLEQDVFLNSLKRKSGDYGIDMRTQMPDYHLYDEYIAVMEGIKKSPAYYKDYKDYSIGFFNQRMFPPLPVLCKQIGA